jgi:hypothetical protein
LSLGGIVAKLPGSNGNVAALLRKQKSARLMAEVLFMLSSDSGKSSESLTIATACAEVFVYVQFPHSPLSDVPGRGHACRLLER